MGKHFRPLICEKEGEESRRFNSTKEVAEFLNLSSATIKPLILNGKKHRSGWKISFADISLEGEIFKKHPTIPYKISNLGRIIGPTGVLLSNRFRNKVGSGGDYYSIRYKKKEYRVHRLVLETFKPNNDQSKFMVDHIDRNKTNNRLENLRWVDYFESNQNRDFSKKS